METQVGSRTRSQKRDFNPIGGVGLGVSKHLYGSALSPRLQLSRTTSVSPAAALWHVQNAVRRGASGAFRALRTPNGKRLPLHDERWDAAGKKYGSVGWHTFRHTYRSWLG